MEYPPRLIFALAMAALAAPQHAGSTSASTAKGGFYAARSVDSGKLSKDTGNRILERIKDLPDALLEPQAEESSPNALDAILAGGQANGAQQGGIDRPKGRSVEVVLAVELSDSGLRTRKSVHDYVRAHLGEFRYAFLKEQAKNPKLSGGIDLELRLEPGGKVDSIRIVRSTLADSGLDANIVERARRMKFEAVDHGFSVAICRLSFRQNP